MANLVGSIEQFDEKNKGDFVSYMERMEQFFLINDSLSTKQSALFITLAGPQVYSTLKNLIAPEDPTKKSFKEIKEALLKHYAPTKSETAERFEFYKATQNPEQSVSQFIMHIRKLANSCNFGSFLDQALRDKLVCGISSEQTQRRLLCEKDLTFSKACQMAIAIESAENQAKALKGGLVEKVTDHVSESSRRSVSSQWRPKGRGQPSMSSTSQPRQSGRGKCRHCGRFHDESRCRARDWKCFTCNRQGHTSVVCWKKNGVKCVNEEEQETSTEEDEINKISTLVCNNVKSVNSSVLLKEMLVNDKPVLMEVDTGASVTVMSSEKFNKLFPLLTLAEHKAKLRGVSGQELNVLGQVIVDVKLSSQDKNVFRLPLIIIDNECRYTLLGRSWLDILYPDWKNCIANINPNVSELYVERFKKDFNTVFDVDRLSFIKDVRVKLVLKENAVPIFHAPYRIPYSIKEAVEMELKEMLESGVLEKTKYSEWASPIVVVPRKSSKKIRICVDFKVTLNPNLKTEHYPLPLCEDIFNTVSKGKYFTTLDLSNAYLQLQVSPESRELLTINTHLGLFRFTRLPFGITSAPAIFQSVMDNILKDIPSCACYIDDIIISGQTIDECRDNVRKVLEKLQLHNVKVNLSKCHFFQESIECLGHVIDGNGIRPMKAKIDEICSKKPPTDLTQLRSFLGLLNYYNKFLPMASSELKLLYDLERKNIPFVWTNEHRVFEKCKNMIVNSNLLVHYDVKKPIVIAVDASQYGVGAVMSHLSDGVEHPIMFASSTLSNSEKNYAQIQKEALAIMFAVRKFHKYIYGRKFTLITDHLPLRTILNVKTGIPTLAASRLQRWALELSAYDYEIKYKKGNENANADFFSRLPSESILNEDVLSFSEFNEIPLSVTDVSMSTKKDKVIARVLEYTKKGWPDKLPDLGLKDYFSKRHELNIENECLLWGNRLVIPFDLREKVLEILHSQHIGIARMKMLARSEVWWPSMDLHIEEHVKRCEMCQLHQNKPIDVPYTPWSKTSKSWKRLHIDFLQFKQYHFLIVVDSHSKWLDIYLMKHGTDSSKTIEKLRQSFLHFGIPEEIVSDNGPPFSGEEYKKFCSSNGINCLLTPPLHACSNGLAEKNVQTVKQALRKSLLNPNNSTKSIQLILDNFIFKHRNTPSVSTGISPASIMLKQQPRTKLTMLKTKLSSTLKEREEKVKIYEDRRRTKLREFVENEKVLAYIIQGRKPVWMEGVVMQRVSAVTYLIKLNGNIRLMHADHLKKSYISENITLPYEDLPDILIPTAQEKPSEPLIAQPSTSVPKPTVQPSLPLSHPVPLRRSAREIKAPSKLNL
uniref:RNA-directed DNA polymerase n=1 Tax=Photinus pyralis TaxID=7054 RepID=A0A1Y1K0Y3_PHOPY